MVLNGITFIPLYFAKNLISMEIISIIHSIAIPMLTVSRSSLIQEIVPPEMTGRVFALINMAVVGMSSVSAGLTGFALEWLGAPMVFLIIGVGGGLCGVIGWIWAKELRVRE
jgi:predicted MFS family arabinose efflux permease